MPTTGVGHLLAAQRLAWILNDANGFQAVLPGFVLSDVSGNPITPLSSGGTVVATGNVAALAADSGNPLKVGGVFRVTQPTAADGQRTDIHSSAKGELGVMPVGVAAVAADGQSNTINYMASSGGLSQVGRLFATAGFLFNGSTWDRKKKPSAVSRIVSSANSTNATVAKASTGDLFAVQGYNTTASVVYLKLYNKASAPTVGTDTPIKTIPIPPNAPVPSSCVWANGLYFSTGIAYALTGAAADNDTTAVAAGAIVGLNLDYQ